MSRIRIAFPTEGDKGLDDRVFEHFGRAPFYTIVEVEDKRVVGVEVLESPFVKNHQPGMVPLFLKEKGVNVIICRGIGGRARAFLERIGIEVIMGAEGKVRDLVEKYLEGTLESREYTPEKRWGDTFH